jgi:hypothetical protein
VSDAWRSKMHPRASGVGVRRRSAGREIARGSCSIAPAATTDAHGRHMSGALMRRRAPRPTRITRNEVAARNRGARFPAPRCNGPLRIASAADPARPLSEPADSVAPLVRRDVRLS